MNFETILRRNISDKIDMAIPALSRVMQLESLSHICIKRSNIFIGPVKRSNVRKACDSNTSRSRSRFIPSRAGFYERNPRRSIIAHSLSSCFYPLFVFDEKKTFPTSLPSNELESSLCMHTYYLFAKKAWRRLLCAVQPSKCLSITFIRKCDCHSLASI